MKYKIYILGTTIYLIITDFSVGEDYTVTVSTSINNPSGGNIDSTANTAQFRGRDTKIDSILVSRPSMYDTSVGTTLRSLLDAIGREDDLIGGSRDDSF